jgi:hypothetical protein
VKSEMICSSAKNGDLMHLPFEANQGEGELPRKSGALLVCRSRFTSLGEEIALSA